MFRYIFITFIFHALVILAVVNVAQFLEPHFGFWITSAATLPLYFYMGWYSLDIVRAINDMNKPSEHNADLFRSLENISVFSDRWMDFHRTNELKFDNFLYKDDGDRYNIHINRIKKPTGKIVNFEKVKNNRK